MKRGEVYWADLVPRSGSEQQGRRPVVVISHNAFTPVAWLEINHCGTNFNFDNPSRAWTIHMSHTELSLVENGLKAAMDLI